MDNIDKIFELYKYEYHEKQKNEKLYNHEKQLIINKKQQDLKILQTFLKKFVDHELYVSHKNTYTWQRKLNLDEEGEKFIFHLIESSKSWSPGISIFFEHPAEVEIAIPNNPEDAGVVVMTVSTPHPDQHLLEQKFYNFNQACEALAKFLSKSTIKIKEYKKSKKIEKVKTNEVSSEDSNKISINKLSLESTARLHELFTFQKKDNSIP